MIVLIDTDVLIDVALDRMPFSESASMLLNAAEVKVFKSFIAWHSLSNFFYIVLSSKGIVKAKQFISDLLEFTYISPTKTIDARYAATLAISNFEDAMQIAAARACRAERIITRNIKHYSRSPIPALIPEKFLRDLK